MKEISSDGDISTIDVIYPASPLFLLLDPGLIVLLLEPLFAYANNETSTKYSSEWAPHDLGTWPIADKTTSQQEDMPIEETANIILMVAAVVKNLGHVDFVLPKYKNLLDQWGIYLVANLPDPGNQLCTDDFTGPSPHNANLAIKGILGLGAFGKFWEIAGDHTKAVLYTAIAKEYVKRWMEFDDDDDHYRLQYDKPRTWSLKYNLFYGLLLQLVGDSSIIPQSILDKEIKYYMKQMTTYGVPLDIRNSFTKLDWEHWVATLGDNAQFLAIVNATYLMAHTTPNRVPLTDWYMTTDGRQSGFQARSVVGGLYAKLLLELTSNKIKTIKYVKP